MLSDQLQQLAREAGGEALLLDARRHRGLVSDANQVIGVLKNLRNAGFTRMIDYTATHLGAKKVGDDQLVENFQMSLVLRAPEHGHEHLVLKWTWPPPVGAHGCAPTGLADETEEGGQPSAPTQETDAPADTDKPQVDPELAKLGVTAHGIGPEKSEEELPGGNGDGLPPRPEPLDSGYNSGSGAGQPGGEPRQAGPVEPHPSLSHIWPAAGLAEREIWEMLGIPFSGHDNLAPLLLDEQFSDFPLRCDFAAPELPSYASELLREREEQALLDLVDSGAAVPGRQGHMDEEGGQGRPPHQPNEDISGGEE